MTKSCATIIITSIFFISVVLPLAKVRAQVELPFGGLANFPIPCTCSLTVAVWFTPLYLGGPAAVTGPLVYSPYLTIPYAYYLVGVPGVWHLGSYIPGVQACWMYVGVACVPFPTLGVMTKVGTNRPF